MAAGAALQVPSQPSRSLASLAADRGPQDAWAPELQLLDPGAQAQWLRYTGSAAPRPVGSSQVRD